MPESSEIRRRSSAARCADKVPKSSPSIQTSTGTVTLDADVVPRCRASNSLHCRWCWRSLAGRPSDTSTTARWHPACGPKGAPLVEVSSEARLPAAPQRESREMRMTHPARCPAHRRGRSSRSTHRSAAAVRTQRAPRAIAQRKTPPTARSRLGMAINSAEARVCTENSRPGNVYQTVICDVSPAFTWLVR